MKKRALGKNGLEVSALGLGCMTIGKDYSVESKSQATEKRTITNTTNQVGAFHTLLIISNNPSIKSKSIKYTSPFAKLQKQPIYWWDVTEDHAPPL